MSFGFSIDFTTMNPAHESRKQRKKQPLLKITADERDCSSVIQLQKRAFLTDIISFLNELSEAHVSSQDSFLGQMF